VSFLLFWGGISSVPLPGVGTVTLSPETEVLELGEGDTALPAALMIKGGVIPKEGADDSVEEAAGEVSSSSGRFREGVVAAASGVDAAIGDCMSERCFVEDVGLTLHRIHGGRNVEVGWLLANGA
jgi:hypothetical protein